MIRTAAFGWRPLAISERLASGILFTLAMTALSLGEFPKWFGSVVFNDQDAITYLRSVYQAELLIRHGDWFPRLSTVDYLGQGYPLFQFYPPLSYFFPAYLGTIFPLGLQLSVNVAVALLQVAAGWAMFALCRQLGSSKIPAVLAAFSLLTYPYLVFEAHRFIPTFYALAFGTIAIATIASFMKRPSTLGLAAVIFCTFLLPMTHVLSTIILVATIVAFAVCAVPILTQGAPPRSGLLRLGVALTGVALGLALAAFQFEPILIYGLHKWLRISGLGTDPAWILRIANQFVSLPNLLSPRISEGGFLPEPYFGQWGYQFGLVYVLGFFLSLNRLRTQASNRLAFAGIAAIFVIGVIAVLPSTVRTFPTLYPAFQTSYRFLTITAISGAVLVAYGLDPICRRITEMLKNAFRQDEGKSVAASLCAVSIATVVAWSAPAWSDAGNQNDPNSGFINPITVDQILQLPVSTYSGDYLVDGYNFTTMFPDQELYGNAQYFIYWHRLLSDFNVDHPLPRTPLLPAGTKIVAAGRLVAPLKPPLKFTVMLNDQVVGTATISQPKFKFQLALRHDVRDLQSISYRADKSTTAFGIKTAVQFDRIVFEGLPRDRTVYYGSTFHKSTKRLKSTATFVAQTPSVGSIYVVPELYYPGLQQVSIDGKNSDCIPVPRNDLIFCGLRASQTRSVFSIVFRGSVLGNAISIAALIATVALLAGLALTLRKRNKPALIA